MLTPLLATVIACGGQAAAPAKPATAATSRVPSTPPLCFLATNVGQDVPPGARTYQPGYWLTLLVGGYNGAGDYTRPPRDCRDTVARQERDGCDTDAPLEVLPGRLLTPGDVVIAKVDETRRIVWALTDHLSDGEAQGPVALAELLPKGIAVRALGILRAYPSNVSLRLESLGGAAVLVADAEYCEAGQTADECARAVRLLPLVGDHFVSKALISADGACLGPAFIPVRGSGTIAAHHHAKYRIETLVTFSPESIVIREQLAIDRQSARSDEARSSYVTRMQVDRQVTVRAGNLVASGPSLLARWLAHQGKDMPSSAAP